MTREPDCPCRVAQESWKENPSSTLVIEIPHAGSFSLRNGFGPKTTYGLWLWPAGVALAHEVASRKWDGLNVLELGPGLGLAAMTVARLGGKMTLAEKLPEVNARTRANLAANGVAAEFLESTWEAITGSFDAIIASETCYTEETASATISTVKRCWNKKGPVLICDPDRPGTRERMAGLTGAVLTTARGLMGDGGKFECNMVIISNK